MNLKNQIKKKYLEWRKCSRLLDLYWDRLDLKESDYTEIQNLFEEDDPETLFNFLRRLLKDNSVFEVMTIRELRDFASRAGIRYYAILPKDMLVKELLKYENEEVSNFE